jgi:hypothetical protein
VAPLFRRCAAAASTRRWVARASVGLSPFLPLLFRGRHSPSPLPPLSFLSPLPARPWHRTTCPSRCDPRGLYSEAGAVAGPTNIFFVGTGKGGASQVDSCHQLGKRKGSVRSVVPDVWMIAPSTSGRVFWLEMVRPFPPDQKKTKKRRLVRKGVRPTVA